MLPVVVPLVGVRQMEFVENIGRPSEIQPPLGKGAIALNRIERDTHDYLLLQKR